MKRFAIGAALGGAAVYFLDPQRGETRRERMQTLWRDNRDSAFEVGHGVAQAAGSMPPLVRRVKRNLGRMDLARGGGPNWRLGITGTATAVAIGGALVYFFDPKNGPDRRRRVLSFLEEQQGAMNAGFESTQKAARTVKSRAQRAIDDISNGVEEVRAADVATR